MGLTTTAAYASHLWEREFNTALAGTICHINGSFLALARLLHRYAPTPATPGGAYSYQPLMDV
jgi:hypothetical protein